MARALIAKTEHVSYRSELLAGGAGARRRGDRVEGRYCQNLGPLPSHPELPIGSKRQRFQAGKLGSAVEDARQSARVDGAQADKSKGCEPDCRYRADPGDRPDKSPQMLEDCQFRLDRDLPLRGEGAQRCVNATRPQRAITDTSTPVCETAPLKDRAAEAARALPGRVSGRSCDRPHGRR